MLEFIDLIEQALHAIEHLSRAGIAAAAAADRAAYADADDAAAAAAATRTAAVGPLAPSVH